MPRPTAPRSGFDRKAAAAERRLRVCASPLRASGGRRGKLVAACTCWRRFSRACRLRAGPLSRATIGLRTTVSPNGDGVRDAAIIRFRLARPATVTIEAVRTDTIRVGRAAGETIWSRRWRLSAGPHALRWRPARSTPPRIPAPSFGAFRPEVDRLRLARPRRPATSPRRARAGRRRRLHGAQLRARESAELELGTDARGVSLQVYAYSTTVRGGDQDFKTSGTAMTPSVLVDWTDHRTRRRASVSCARDHGRAACFLRAAATDGRVGYAPFILHRAGSAR